MSYEFSEDQNHSIRSLGEAMLFVALMLTVIGLVGGGAFLYAATGAGGVSQAVPYVVENGALLVMGLVIFASARRFLAIVKTRGSDIAHLVSAIGWLRWVYLIEVGAVVLSVGLNIHGILTVRS